MPEEKTEFCCAMRRKFLVQIIGQNPSAPEPPDLVDFIDWDIRREDRLPVIRIRHCPFCGAAAKGPVRTMEVCECGHVRQAHAPESGRCAVTEKHEDDAAKEVPCFCETFRPMS